jgi:restriction system protein
MTMSEPTLWGIHAGKTGDAHNLFLKKKVAALGWKEVSDLSQLEANRESFKAAIAAAYPAIKPGAIPVNAGQLYRFVHEMQPGDLLIYPAKVDKQIYIGRVTGEYQYNPQLAEGYPHQRTAEWLNAFPRTRFSQGALYEIGSAIGLFQVKNYAEEFLAALEGKAPPTPIDEDETVALVSQDIEQITRDFIIKTLSQEMKGHPFAEFVAHLLSKMGYYTRVSPAGPDGGVDILAHRDELGFDPPIVKVQVKSADGNIGDPTVSALYGKVGANEHGLLITLGGFTKAAKNFADSRTNLRLIDGDELVSLILNHYDAFDSRYKGILPLKRIFIPEAIIEQE